VVQKTKQQATLSQGSTKAGTKEDAKDRQFVTALSRGLRILRCFNETCRELGSRELARLCQLPHPTVWRLCYTLVQEGVLVQHAASGKFSVGLPALALGFAALSSAAPLDLIITDLQVFADKSGAWMSISTRVDMEMLYLQRSQGGPGPFTAPRPPGARIPMLLSPGGWAYVGAHDAEGRKRLMAQISAHDPTLWTAHSDSLRTALKDYDKTGFILMTGVIHPSVSAIAVPIKAASGNIFGLTCGSADPSIKNLKKLGADLIALGQRITPVFREL
jgi:DNA-binding IclR family transcriptional regulator